MIARLFIFVAAMVASTAALAQGYVIKPGDTLSIEVIEDSSLNRRVLVTPDGTVSFPLVGSLSAAGSSLDTFGNRLSSALAPNFASTPSVFVSVASLAAPQSSAGAGASSGSGGSMTIYVLGEVGNPGPIQITPGTTLLQALSRTGGFGKFAATRRIQLRRVNPATGGYATYKFNYRAIESGASITGQTILGNGDVIVVPQKRLFE